MIPEVMYTHPLEGYEKAANATLTEGLIALNSDGKVVQGADTANLQIIGLLNQEIPGGEVIVKSGCFIFENPTTNGFTRADRGKIAYATANGKVASASTNQIVAGIVIDVTSEGVVVEVSPCAFAVANVSKEGSAITNLASDANVATTVTTVNAMLGVLRANGLIANS